MNEKQPHLNIREKYVVALMFIIAACFLLLQVVAIISSRAKAIVVEADSIRMSRNEIYSFIRVGLTIVLSLAGAILFSRKKAIGWTLSFAVLLLFTLILGAILYGIINTFQTFDLTIIMGLFGLLVLILGIVFLLLPDTRQKFRAGRKLILTALLLFILMGGMFFFLQ